MQVEVIEKPLLVFDRATRKYTATLRARINGTEYGERREFPEWEVQRYNNALEILPFIQQEMTRRMAWSLASSIEKQIEDQLND